MTCRELTDFIMEYIEGDLDPVIRRTFDRHLDECPACVMFIESYRTSISLGQEAFGCGDGSPCEVPEELVRAILEATQGRGPEMTSGGCGCGG